ncbi:hypothetical protein ABBQ32_010826 [Trebouxia sp. C0010 RCD-2024]
MSMTVGSAVCPTNAMLAPRQARAAAGVESHQRARCMPSGSHLLGGQPRHSVHGRSCHVTRTLATGANVAPMVHPPGPSKMYPEENQAIEDYLNELALELLRNEEESQVASASPETTGVIETPPEWGRPDEGNPNQPRRVPEYQPPQEPVPGIGRPPPEFDPPGRSRPSPPVPEDDPMRPLPPQQPEIPPNERDPLKKAPEQMPGERPERRGDEQTQPQPGEAQADAFLSEEEIQALAEQDPEQAAEAAEQATLYYIDWCRQSFAIRDLVDFYLADTGSPMVHLTHPYGNATAIVQLHGANVTSWTGPDGTELLHLRKQQQPDDPVEGGIPICFPNLGYKHGMPTDGFLKDWHWSVVETTRSPEFAEDPAPSVTLLAESDEATMEIWPHKFAALYTVQLMIPDELPDIVPSNRYHQPRPQEKFGGIAEATLEPEAPKELELPTMQLRCQLEIFNTDSEPFTFTTGLQQHLACRDLRHHHDFARILGLGGKHYVDYTPNARKPKLRLEQDDYVNFGQGAMERVYIDAQGSTVKFCPGDRTHFEVLLRQGLTDLGATNSFLAHERHSEFADFVVLTPAQSGRAVTLQPGEVWTGEVAMRWHDKYWEIPLFDRGPQPNGLADPMPGYEKLERERKMPVMPPRQAQDSKRMPSFDQQLSL